MSTPGTVAESLAYQRKTVALARRCGEVSGDLLSHISTADTARDLDALRIAVGDAADPGGVGDARLSVSD